eukprot:FR742556.1.p1 GENE.FR742556.1~~FR742556.1.p1  ORF type:complete len:160 (+),score=19.25 FR742556.1:37-480(+)
MITTTIAGVPVLWLGYAIVLYCFGAKISKVLLFLVCCPFFSYLAVIAAESGMVDLKDLKPLLLRLMVNHEEMKKLMTEREDLQKMVRATVKKYGPDIGEVYFERNVSWTNLQGGDSRGSPRPVSRGNSRDDTRSRTEESQQENPKDK